MEEIQGVLDKCEADCPSFLDIELQDASSMSKAELLFKPMVRVSYAATMIFHHWALISIHEDPTLKQESREKTRFYAVQLYEVRTMLVRSTTQLILFRPWATYANTSFSLSAHSGCK